MSRTWDIWWDFEWEAGVLKGILVETSHPDYQHVPYLYRLPLCECQDSSGHVDEWETVWFEALRSDLLSGRTSIHTLMKSLGHQKQRSRT
jgi:hypothetical protein